MSALTKEYRAARIAHPENQRCDCGAVAAYWRSGYFICETCAASHVRKDYSGRRKTKTAAGHKVEKFHALIADDAPICGSSLVALEAKLRAVAMI